MSVRNLPLFPEHIQKINTPRAYPYAGSAYDAEQVKRDREDMVRAITESKTNFATAESSVASRLETLERRNAFILAAHKEEWNQSLREVAKRMVSQPDLQTLKTGLERLVADVQIASKDQGEHLHAEIAMARKEAADLRAAVTALVSEVLEIAKNVENQAELQKNAALEASVQGNVSGAEGFTPLQWFLIIFSLGTYRPTKYRP